MKAPLSATVAVAAATAAARSGAAVATPDPAAAACEPQFVDLRRDPESDMSE